MSKSELGEFWEKTKKVAGDVTENAKKDFAEVSAIAKKELSGAKQTAEETIQMVADDAKVAGQKVKAKVEDVVDDAKVIAKDVNDLAGKATVKGYEAYENLEVGKRAAGAAAGAKVGFWVAVAARNPLVGKVSVPVGAVVGAIKGKDWVEKGQEWYNGHKEKFGSKKNNNTPS